MVTSFFHFRSHIEKAGHTCELRDAAEFQSPAEVAHLLSQNPPFEGALAIHLFRAGKLLLGKHPFVWFVYSSSHLQSFVFVIMIIDLWIQGYLPHNCHYLSVLCLTSTPDIQLPFGVIFGGTDINEDVKVEQKRVVMEQVLLKARWRCCKLLL